MGFSRSTSRTRILVSSSWFPLVRLFLIVSCVNNAVSVVYGQCQSDQRVFLLRLKNNLTFPVASSTKLAKWNQTVDCCKWDGVNCDRNGRVIGLDLSSESISGGIDDKSTLFGLQYLRSLDLSFNNFGYSPIPPGIGKLTNLAYLNLSNAGFSGQIPLEVSYLTKLLSLDLSTLFPGTDTLRLENPNLTLLVQNLTKLKELYLDEVKVSAKGKEWCEALSSSLPNLRVLSMASCNLSGPFEPSLLKLQHLSTVRLSGNNLSTSLPGFLGEFPNLVGLKLSLCGLSGRLPSKLLQLPTLRTLDLSDNELLEGSISDFPPDGSLQTLLLSYTGLSGKLPESIGNLKSLSRIDLAHCNFSGPIPVSVVMLERMVDLDLSFNQFNGPMPTHWDGLINLENLDLRYNMLSGRIPTSVFSLPSLQKIQLSNNQFSGELNIPSNVPSHQLDTLDVQSNDLEGAIPMPLFELRGLKVLSLAYNNFNGSIHLGWIHKLANLSNLDLSYNNLSIVGSDSSSFPQLTTLRLASCRLKAFPDLRKQSTLGFLDLSDNQLQGHVPNWIWNVGKGFLSYLNLSHNLLVDFEKPYSIPLLSVLDIHANVLTGNLPPLNLSATYLDYSNNKFTSSISADIGDFPESCIFISLSNNSLTGSIPKSLCHASSLRVLDLSNNELWGKVPECLVEIMSTSLGVLNLRRNNFNGTIPDKFLESCALQTLDLNSNQIEGQLPRSLSNCTSLEVLDVGENQIHDTFPRHLNNISTLRVVVLRSNRFYSSISCPENDDPWPMLQILDLASNNFSSKPSLHCLSTWKAMMGDVNTDELLKFEFLTFSPNNYYQDAITVTSKGVALDFKKILTVLTVIDLSSNNFQGSIPEVMGGFRGLYALNLSHNALTGEIPSVLGNLQHLESLDLSSNNLSGEIPVELTKLTFLSSLNLSFNELDGKIPAVAQFLTFTQASFQGNKQLCGRPLEVECGDESIQPDATSEPEAKDEFGLHFALNGFGYGMGLGAVVGFIYAQVRAFRLIL